MDEQQGPGARRLAFALGAFAAGSAICLGTYFAIGEPFGALNDIGNAATGVVAGGLAWRLRRRSAGSLDNLAVGAALAGTATTVAGSALVLSGATGFMLAGLVSTLGFAGIGAWLLAAARDSEGWSPSLRRSAVVTGALLVFGLAALPAIGLRIDDMAVAPAWVWISSLAWLGVYIGLPVWAFRYAGAVERPTPAPRPSIAGAG